MPEKCYKHTSFFYAQMKLKIDNEKKGKKLKNVINKMIKIIYIKKKILKKIIKYQLIQREK